MFFPSSLDIGVNVYEMHIQCEEHNLVIMYIITIKSNIYYRF